jgi:hypothetical protein
MQWRQSLPLEPGVVGTKTPKADQRELASDTTDEDDTDEQVGQQSTN